jgi:hypothetical protein
MTIVLKRFEERLRKCLEKEKKLSADEINAFFKRHRKANGTLSWSFFQLGTNESSSENKGFEEAKRADNIAKKTLAKILVQEDTSSIMEYQAYSHLLVDILKQYKENEKQLDYCPNLAKQTAERVEELLDLSILLDQKYSCLINPLTLSKSQLQKDQIKAIAWLDANAPDYTLSAYQRETHRIPEKTDIPGAGKVRNKTEGFNRYRLFLARFWRLFRLAILFSENEYYGQFMLLANPLASMIIIYVGALYFSFRLIANILTISKHVIPGNWMTKDEEELGWLLRLNAQWMRLWPNVSNDTAWITNGVLLLTYFSGALLPFAIFLAFASSAYDFVMASLRFALSTYRFHQLTKKYNGQTSDPLVKQYLDKLENNIQQDKRMLYLALLNFGVVMIGMGLALPWIILLNPALPLVGAVMALFITFVNFGTRDYFIKQRNNADKVLSNELSSLLATPQTSEISVKNDPVTVTVEPPPSASVTEKITKSIVSMLSFSIFSPRSSSPNGIPTNFSGQCHNNDKIADQSLGMDKQISSESLLNGGYTTTGLQLDGPTSYNLGR